MQLLEPNWYRPLYYVNQKLSAVTRKNEGRHKGWNMIMWLMCMHNMNECIRMRMCMNTCTLVCMCTKVRKWVSNVTTCLIFYL